LLDSRYILCGNSSMRVIMRLVQIPKKPHIHEAHSISKT
jgi:hypothetical protein